MRVGRKIQLIVISIVLTLIAALFCFWEEYKTRDNATHLLLLSENQNLLNDIFEHHLKRFDKDEENHYIVLNDILIFYSKIKQNTELLEQGGKYHLGETQKEIIPTYYSEVHQGIQELGLLALSDISNIKKILNQNSIVVLPRTRALLTESASLMRGNSKIIHKKYYELYANKIRIINQGLVTSLIILSLLIILLYWVIYTKILNPNYSLRKALISSSYQNNILKITSNTIFKDVGVHLINLQQELSTSLDFINEIGNGNFDVSLEEKGKLAISLQKMQAKLKESSQKETRTAWTSIGLASLSEIIRNNTDSLDNLGKHILKMIVDYLNCEQSVLYVKKEDRETHEVFFELVNHYGLSKGEYDNTIILEGEGLLGEVLLNPRVIKIIDLPDNYTILTGLGQAKPACLVIIPLLTNQRELVGVLEVASFKEIQEYQVSLLEQMGESIAVSLSSVLNTFHTEQLLIESQDLTKRLKNQEEYMRKNMQALQQAQQEMVKNQIELEGVFKSIDQTLGTIEINIDGNIISINQMILGILNFDETEMIGKEIKDFFINYDQQKETFENLWSTLLQDESITGDYQWKNKHNKLIWLNLTLTPVKNQKGEIFKIIILAKDITQRKEEELEIQRLSLVADTTDNAVLIINHYGVIEYINPGFTKMTGYAEEVNNEKPNQFLYGEKTDKKIIINIEKNLSLEMSFTEEVLMYHKNGETYWASLSVNPVFDSRNVLEKHIFLLVDITDTKTSELDYSYKMNAISHSNAMLEIDLTGKILMSNENFSHIFGYEESELVDLSYFSLIKEEDNKRYEDLLKVVNKGEFLSGEYRRIHKTGKELWIKEVYNPIFDLAGNLIKIIVFTIDITQEKLLEVVSEEKDLELKEHSKAVNKTIASVEFSIDGKILGANDIFLGVFGYSLEQIVGQDESILLLETDRIKPQHQLMWENLKAGKFFEGEFQNIGYNQKPIWLKGTYNPIFNREGHPYKIKMLAQFTTDDKERETNLNGIVQAVKENFLYIELNNDLTIKISNNLFLSFIGYKRMELRKLSVSTLIKNFTSEDYQELVNSLLIDGNSVQKKFVFEKKDKTQKTFNCTFHPIKNLENQISKIIVFLV